MKAFKTKAVLTGLRPDKYNSAELFATPTTGQFRLTPQAAKALDVTKADTVAIKSVDTEDGEIYVIYKPTATEKGRKLDFANATAEGGSLQFSDANPYQALGGNPDFSIRFKLLGTTEEDKDEAGLDEFDQMCFPLVEVERVPKVQRKASAKNVEGAEGADDEGDSNDESSN